MSQQFGTGVAGGMQSATLSSNVGGEHNADEIVQGVQSSKIGTTKFRLSSTASGELRWLYLGFK